MMSVGKMQPTRSSLQEAALLLKQADQAVNELIQELERDIEQQPWRVALHKRQQP